MLVFKKDKKKKIMNSLPWCSMYYAESTYDLGNKNGSVRVKYFIRILPYWYRIVPEKAQKDEFYIHPPPGDHIHQHFVKLLLQPF